MRNKFFVLLMSWMLMSSVIPAEARVTVDIGLPNVNIGINVPFFPELVPVTGYPVYYAPDVDGNYFFYDGLYWVYQDDNWYASVWYNGPWDFVEPEFVPLFVLRIPVRYYQQPPVYFRGWEMNAPPRWGRHWGHEWEHHRRGWDRWNRSHVPARAPRPSYQREYSGDRYPRGEQQHSLRNESYRYQSRDKVVRKYSQPEKQDVPVSGNLKKRDTQRNTPAQQSYPVPVTRSKPQNKVQEAAPERSHPQRASEQQDRRHGQPGLKEIQHRSPDSGESRETGRGHGHDRKSDGDRGRNNQ